MRPGHCLRTGWIHVDFDAHVFECEGKLRPWLTILGGEGDFDLPLTFGFHWWF